MKSITNSQNFLIFTLLGSLLEPTATSDNWALSLRKKSLTTLFHLAKNGTYQLALAYESHQSELAKQVLQLLEREGFLFDEILDFTKGTAVKTWQLNHEHSVVIGSDESAQQLAASLKLRRISLEPTTEASSTHWQVDSWDDLYALLVGEDDTTVRRSARLNRKTKETSIECEIFLDGTGRGEIATGLPFFDHMLEQIWRHGRLDGTLRAQGDLEIDEHHTIEDVGLVLGQVIHEAVKDKRGLNRYGFTLLPMDETLATVAIDLSGRPCLSWDVDFSRPTVGNFPLEMVYHFFKSFSDEAKCALSMSVTAGNAHHQVEALFKAFGRALRMATFRHHWDTELPSTKGVL